MKLGRSRGGLLAQPLQGAQVDQRIGQGIEVGDGLAVAEFRAFDAQLDSLAVDALVGGALLVDFLILRAVAIQRMAQACADAECQSCRAPTFGPARMLNGTSLLTGLWVEQGTDVAAFLMRQESGLVHETVLQRHGETGGAARQAILSEPTWGVSLVDEEQRGGLARDLAISGLS